MRIILLIILTVCSGILSLSQEKRKLFIEGKYHHGRLIKHSEKVEPLIKGSIEMLELNYVIPTIGKRKWSQIYRYPEFGLGYQLAFWKNPEMLGNSHTVNMYIRVPIIKTKPFKFYYHIGTGPCYFKKIYDPETNPLNLSIGSHLNLYVHAGLEARLRLTNNLMINAGYGMNHYSIGNLAQPNVGLNVDSKYISLNYSINHDEITYIKHDIEKKVTGHEIWGYIGPGYKEIEIDLDTNLWGSGDSDFGHKYFTSTISINYAYQVNYKRKFGIGLEYFYDRSLRKRLEVQGEKKIYHRDLFRPGFNISHELLFSDLSFITQFGWYIYSKSTRFGSNYYRVALKYHFKDNWFTILAIKAHLPAIADFTEWGIGYRINR